MLHILNNLPTQMILLQEVTTIQMVKLKVCYMDGKGFIVNF